MPSATDPNYAAQAILARRPHTEQELRLKLQRKKFSARQIDTVVAKLKKLQLIDDHQFARVFVDTTVQLKPVGPRWFADRLRQKGVGESIINQVVGQAFSADREQALVQQAADHWRRTHPRHATDTQRLARHLTSRGFGTALIAELLAEATS